MISRRIFLSVAAGSVAIAGSLGRCSAEQGWGGANAMLFLPRPNPTLHRTSNSSAVGRR